MAMELMITDCFLAADHELELSAKVDHAENFVFLDDTILKVMPHLNVLMLTALMVL